MDQVNQMNILRESNSVLRDEKIRALEEKESANKIIKDLELEIEPLRRKENEFSEELKKKDAEKKAVEESMTKLKATHEEQVLQAFVIKTLTNIFFSRSKKSRLRVLQQIKSKRLSLPGMISKRNSTKRLLNIEPKKMN